MSLKNPTYEYFDFLILIPRTLNYVGVGGVAYDLGLLPMPCVRNPPHISPVCICMGLAGATQGISLVGSKTSGIPMP